MNFLFSSDPMPTTIREKNGGTTRVLKLEDDWGWVLLHSSGKAEVSWKLKIRVLAFAAAYGIYWID